MNLISCTKFDCCLLEPWSNYGVFTTNGQVLICLRQFRKMKYVNSFYGMRKYPLLDICSMSNFGNFRIPVQSLLPLGIITGALVAGSLANEYIKKWANDGVQPRFSLDIYEKMLMERDRRLVGDFIKQSDSLDAPPEFTTNSKSFLVRI